MPALLADPGALPAVALRAPGELLDRRPRELELPAAATARQGPLRARRDRRRQARQPRPARPRAQPRGLLRPMRRLLLASAVALLLAPPAAQAASVTTMVVGKELVLRAAKPVKLAD